MRTIANKKTRVSLDLIYPKPLSEIDIRDIYATKNSPALTGTPTTVTPVTNSDVKMIANKEYVDNAIADLVDSAPEELDTLKELADALNTEDNAISAINSTLATKLDANSSNYIKSISGEYSISAGGTNISYTKGNNTSSSFIAKDTTYSAGTRISINANNEISADDQLPSRTGNNGKFLTTNGSTMSWDTPSQYKTHLYAGTGSASNATVTTNGNVKLTVSDDSTVNTNSSVIIKGDGTYTNVTSDNGIITITGKDTVTTVTSPSTGNTGNAVTSITATNGVLTVTKGSTFSLSNHNHDSAYTALKKSIGTATKPVYTNSDGVITACTYELNKTVPADAVFTDTTYNVFGASGTNHASGLVPDPGSTAGSTKYLCENKSWSSPYPSQSGNSGKYLTTNGSTVSWATVSALPSQTNNSGKFLTTNGTTASWATVSALPSQSNNSGKYLTTNGSTASWGSIFSNGHLVFPNGDEFWVAT